MKRLSSLLAIVAIAAVAGMFNGCQKAEKPAPVEQKTEVTKPAEAAATDAAAPAAAPAPAAAKE